MGRIVRELILKNDRNKHRTDIFVHLEVDTIIGQNQKGALQSVMTGLQECRR